MRKKLDLLIFDAPMFSNGGIPRERLLNDNLQSREIPKGPLCLASYLSCKGLSVKVVDFDSFFPEPVSEKESFFRKVFALILRKAGGSDPSFIGFSMMFGFTEKIIIEMTRFCRKSFPDVPIVVGGNHATFVAERLLSPHSDTGIDIVVRGEGERTMEELIRGKSPNKIAGLSFRDNKGDVHHNPFRQPLPIWDFPPNDYSLLDIGKGVDIAHFNHMVQYARGCSFNCSFCTNESMWARRVRPLDSDVFRKELYSVLDFNQRIPGNPITVIIDDDLLANKKSWAELFPIFSQAQRDFPKTLFAAQARVSGACRDDYSTHQMLEQLEELHFAMLFLGIESGSQTILDAMGKRCQVEWIFSACENLKKHHLPIGAFWMFGHPGATVKEEQESLRVMEFLLTEGLIDELEAHMTIPFPGTNLRLDPRVQLLYPESEEADMYSLANPRPIHRLINPNNGDTVMSQEDIEAVFLESLKIKERHLGYGEARVNISSS